MPTINEMDLAGRRFGRIRVIRRAGVNNYNNAMWLCECHCGTRKNIMARSLLYGDTRSCSCLRRERCTIHGMEGTPLYKSWEAMIKRCIKPNDASYKNYGARGISVCPRWRTFAAFYSDMGNRPDGTSIDRINNDGDYEPDNCRWATHLQQARNTRHNHMITWRGEAHCASEWAEIMGLNRHNIYRRLGLGWSIERTLTEPLGSCKHLPRTNRDV